MTVVFRVDSSTRMGIGHLVRCLTLAEALRARGAQTRFICREHPGHLALLLQQQAMPVTLLPAAAFGDASSGEDYAAWLGVTQVEDAAQTIEALHGERPDWLVVDHYGLDVEWERRLRLHAGKLMVIDDLASRHHDCDALLNQNYSAEGERRYAALVPAACKLLMGPRYALLRPEYAAYRKTLRARDGQVGSVLVFFGGSDPHNMTGMALAALSHAGLRHLKVNVVVGANNPHREALENQAEGRPKTAIHGPRPHLADLMTQADLAVGAGGATTWERMCLALPAIVVAVANNQESTCAALANDGFINYLGSCAGITAGELTLAVEDMASNTDFRSDLAKRSTALVDGLGTSRIADIALERR